MLGFRHAVAIALAEVVGDLHIFNWLASPMVVAHRIQRCGTVPLLPVPFYYFWKGKPDEPQPELPNAFSTLLWRLR